MFCDIRGFSAYSQTAAPAEMVAFLDEYFSIASYVILHRFDGVINKLMGDGLLAYWGFPLPQEDHAYIATQAAIQILKEVDLRNRTTSHPMPLNVGIGIASGEAIVGNIGSADFKDFTLLGVPVNLASRLEEANKRLNTSLLISSATYAGLKGRLDCRDCGEVEIRGWQGNERIFAPRLTFADS
jgi:adenylate cyclase